VGNNRVGNFRRGELHPVTESEAGEKISLQVNAR
jgi:hypothetical protein